jgi:hypothetical protein
MMPPGEPPAPVPASDELRLLVDDAAQRAAAMLAGIPPETTGSGAAAELPDAIRMLAAPGRTGLLPAVAAHAGLPEEEIRRLLLAYRHGGQPGVAAAHAACPAPYTELDEAVRQIRVHRAFTAEPLEPDDHGVTDPSAQVQVRWGPDGRWYPFTYSRDRWWPAPGAAETAGQAYRAALKARRAR